jgi:peptide-methionine (S)-S-oxide reductase
MKNADITDAIFLQAVEAIDAGNINALKSLLSDYPRLITKPLDRPGGDYFKNPYLLWFVADNPIRVDKLAPNIVEITRLLVKEVKNYAHDSWQKQLDYTLGLVVTGRIPRECGVQIEMIDLLIDEGAQPGGGIGAIAHGNIGAAKRLVERGGEFTLAAAVGLKQMDDVYRLLPGAGDDEKVVALTVAAFYGNTGLVFVLLNAGANPNGYPAKSSGFHSHATPLHQAVYSGSLDAVKLLVEAGASLSATDKVYDGTPIGWAMYMQAEEAPDEETKQKYAAIEKYLADIESKT